MLERQFKKVGAAFINSKEVSSQGCVYRCLPELWLRKMFPGTIIINTALPGQSVRTMKSKEQMAELDDDSTEIFNSIITERYSDRPDRNFMNGIYSGVENLCLSEFASFIYRHYQTEDNKPMITNLWCCLMTFGKSDHQESNNKIQKSKSCCEVSYTQQNLNLRNIATIS